MRRTQKISLPVYSQDCAQRYSVPLCPLSRKRGIFFIIHTRTIREAAAWFREKDPNTALTETAIRTLLRTGKVPCAKVGKSFMMAQLCVCVSSGKPFLGFQTEPCTVLYLALEDRKVRMQARLGKMYGTEWSGKNLHFIFRTDCQGESLTKLLYSFLASHPDTKLIVIDTLQCARTSGGGKFSYEADYNAILPFKQFSNTYNLAMILVHHTRKDTEDPDPFKQIPGTNGLMGAADGAFILHSAKGQMLLDTVGRDLPAHQYILKFDKGTCLWTLLSDREPAPQEPPEPLLEILDVILPDQWQGTPSDLNEMVNEFASAKGVILRKDGDPEKPLAANAMTRMLNILAPRLLRDHRIEYKVSRSEKRHISFARLPPPQSDGIDDDDGNSPTR